MIKIVDYITIIISTYFLLANLKKMNDGSRFLVYLFFFMFYVFPLYLDYFVEMADYSYSYKFWGYTVSRANLLVNITYDFALVLCQYYILYRKIHKRNAVSELPNSFFNLSLFRWGLFLGMIAPSFFVLLLIHEPAMLYTFQWRENDLFSTAGSYAHIERLTYVAVSCSIFFMFLKFDCNKLFKIIIRLFSIGCLYTNICIQGKRGMLMFAVVNLFLVLYWLFVLRNKKKKIRLGTIVLSVVLGVLAGGGMLASTYFIKLGRGYSTDLASVMYTSTRIDFLRDDRVRMAIFAEQNPSEMKILDYPCQTLLTDVVAIVPIDYIVYFLTGFDNDKSYQHYFTHAMEHNIYSNSFKSQDYSYETVTVFAELISNLGVIIGTIVFIVLSIGAIKLSDKFPYPLNIMTLCSYFLLNIYHFAYIVYYLEATFIFWIIYKSYTKKQRDINYQVL